MPVMTTGHRPGPAPLPVADYGHAASTAGPGSAITAPGRGQRIRMQDFDRIALDTVEHEPLASAAGPATGVARRSSD